MIKIVGASSLYHSINKLEQSEQDKLADPVHSFPGLNLDPSTSNYCLDYLTSTPLRNCKVVLWHDLLNNTTTSHPKKGNIPQTIEELIATLKTIPNLFCVVTCQRKGAPYIFDYLLNSLDCYVIDVTKHIISASERIDESLIAEYRKLHQAADIESRTLATVLHYFLDFNRIFKTRGTKRRTAAEKREAKRRKF